MTCVECRKNRADQMKELLRDNKKNCEEAYNKGRAEAIDEIKESIIPTLYEFDVMQDTIDFCVKWLEQLKEQNK